MYVYNILCLSEVEATIPSDGVEGTAVDEVKRIAKKRRPDRVDSPIPQRTKRHKCSDEEVNIMDDGASGEGEDRLEPSDEAGENDSLEGGDCEMGEGIKAMNILLYPFVLCVAW